jgi:hypothetical protein
VRRIVCEDALVAYLSVVGALSLTLPSTGIWFLLHRPMAPPTVAATKPAEATDAMAMVEGLLRFGIETVDNFVLRRADRGCGIRESVRALVQKSWHSTQGLWKFRGCFADAKLFASRDLIPAGLCCLAGVGANGFYFFFFFNFFFFSLVR